MSVERPQKSDEEPKLLENYVEIVFQIPPKKQPVPAKKQGVAA